MGWLDANEYFLMEMAGRDRIDDIMRPAPLVTTPADSHDGADVTPRFAGRLMGLLLSPRWRVAPDHVTAGYRR